LSAEYRHLQQRIDQQPHPANSVFDALQMLSCFHRHHRAKVIHQDPGITGDVAEWGTQVMGNGVGKGLQFVVGGLQLLGTLCYPLFQVFVELADLQFICFSPRNITERKA
jgi:hypothetical protein